ncbi:glycine zipper 2TM domain-containing protein [Janthinobacterium agaricidamnosum]|uniref:Rickettsia 17 kDa surface antigen family protein n=1 Tax=Janthinobacterium agaricidamnosum NBRC 102515 = DSM 9628 TaxID=1349767 RepID=W0V1W9_9BURK|nr:glycine zipper 2TM domain-containing protein [Janthinobacterium agaricidamnosum]CDG81272.1 rickettsia 17 kDa surface antigen family protein [Janthinobacterium agaricidamnosum NBRC 102515 = DSM 9628]
MKALITIALISTLAGCAVAPNSNTVYTTRQAQSEQSVRLATVESVRQVTIDKGSSGTGVLAGAALGGLAGSTVGGGKGSIATSIIGAIAGGAVGQNVEANVNNKPGFEITVRLDNGELRSIVQDADEAFRPGERVRLLSDGRKTRVTH